MSSTTGEVRPRASYKWGESAEERFWRRIDKRGPDECWEWQASRNARGYGQLGNPERKHSVLRAHRLAWEIANGRPVPKGMVVRHLCGNPPCCNATHLAIGSAWDNSQDMIAHGRSSRGERSGMAKLTEDLVLQIRRLAREGRTAIEIAAAVGISRPSVYSAATGETWAHLPGAVGALPRRKPRLNDDVISEVRRRVRGGERQCDVARSLGIHFTTISRVVNGHIGGNERAA